MGRLNNKFINTVLFGLEMDELFTDVEDWEFDDPSMLVTDSNNCFV